MKRRRSEPLIRRAIGRPRGSRDRIGAARRPVPDRVLAHERRVVAQLRAAREAANVSVAELAAALGVWPETVHGYESGRRIVRLPRLIQIAHALDLPLEHLVTG